MTRPDLAKWKILAFNSCVINNHHGLYKVYFKPGWIQTQGGVRQKQAGSQTDHSVERRPTSSRFLAASMNWPQ